MIDNDLYKQYYLGDFVSSWDTDDECVAYEKYRLLYYYYETEEHDRLCCGPDGIPKTYEQRWSVNRFANEARKKVINWKYKKDFGHMSHDEIKDVIIAYEEKYPHFRTV